jgi:glucosamine--fructose-6-phosphate aminotransferase (isomerizing)
VVVLASRSPVLEKVQGNIEEVAARGGRIIALTEPDNYQVRDRVESVISVPQVPLELSPIVLVTPLQLLAYHIADDLCPLPKPLPDIISQLRQSAAG